MALDPTISDRSNGQTIDQTWFNLIKQVLENHEDRIVELEAEYIRIEFHSNTLQDHLSLTASGVKMMNIPSDLTVIEAGLQYFTAGSANTLECDVQYKRGGGAWTSIFSSRPQLAYNDADSKATGTIDNTNDKLDENDLLRLNIHSLQTNIRKWMCYVVLQRRS